MSDLHRPLRSTIPDRDMLVAGAVAFAGFVAILCFVLLSGGGDAVDLWVASQVPLLRAPTASRFATALTDLGSSPALIAVSLLAIAVLGFKTHRAWASAILASSVAATAGLVTLLKVAVDRPRPSVSTLVGSPARDLSFPSGHTTNATLVYVLAALLLTDGVRRALWRRMAMSAAVVLSLLIGLSRIYLGYHWATDVLAGWLLATGVIAVSYFTGSRLGPADRAEALLDSTPHVPHRRTRAHHLV